MYKKLILPVLATVGVQACTPTVAKTGKISFLYISISFFNFQLVLLEFLYLIFFYYSQKYLQL